MSCTYGGWQKEDPQILGFAPTTLAAGLALVCLVIALLGRSWVLFAFLGPCGALLLGCALVRLAGRSVIEWGGVALGYAVTEAGPGTGFCAPAISRIETASGQPVGQMQDDHHQWVLPGVLHPLRHLVAHDEGRGALIGVIADPRNSTYSAVADLRYAGVALLDTDALERRVKSWGDWLAQQCGEEAGLARLSVYEWIEPGEDDALYRWVKEHRSSSVPEDVTRLVDGLARRDRAANTSRRTFLVVSISAARSRREIRGLGRGDEGASALLSKRTRAIEAALGPTGLGVDHWLSPGEVFCAIRTSFDPAYRIEADLGKESDLPASLAGPNRTHARFGSYSHDGYESLTAELSFSESPRSASVLAGLLGGDGISRRAIALHAEPLSPTRARRQLGAARTMEEMRSELKRRTGRIERAGDKRARRLAERQDAELAAGAGVVRFCGYATVTVARGGDLDAALATLRNDASYGGIVLRRCVGWMDAAFVAGVVPVGFGLGSKWGLS